MFDLTDGGWSLQRHRWFESNAPIMAPGPCRHAGRRFISVHGDLSVNDRPCGGKRRPGRDMRAGVERARRLMGAPWASPRGLSLGIPPVYTQFIGEQLMAHLTATHPLEAAA
jgi:DNA (cytosine-5)-methyltransferase 1